MSQRPSSIAKIVTAVTIAILAIGFAPDTAEAQARGMMQVSASVVSTDDAFRALDAARAAVANLGQPAQAIRTNTVPTVARVSIARETRSVVVTISYSRS